METKIKEYADGWITEKDGTEVPNFLKLAYVIIIAATLTYFLIFMYGEVNDPDRGRLVRALNDVTQASGSLMYAVAGMIVVFGVVVVAFSFRKSNH